MRIALKKAGPAGRHRYHDLKASYTTALAHAAPGRVVRQLARHKSFQTTELYIRVADEATRAAVKAVANRASIAGRDLSRPLGKATTKTTTKPAGGKKRKRLSA